MNGQDRINGLLMPRSAGMYDFPEAPSIRPWDDDEKDFLRSYQLGKMLVFGVEGSGKGVFLSWLATRFRRFWPTRPLVTDIYFTEEFVHDFGPYTYIDQEVMLEQIEATENLAKKAGREITKEEIEEWVVDGKAGGIRLRNCILLLDEFDTWANRMRPTSKVNEMTRGLQKRYRHYKMLMVGACPSEDDLDTRILNAMMYKVECSTDDYRPDYFNYTWYTGHGIGSRGILKVAKVERSSVYGRPLYPYFISDAPVAVMSRNRPKKKKLISEEV